MRTEKPRIAIITDVVPAFRRGFYQRLFSENQLDVSVFCQSHVPGINAKTIEQEFPERIHLIPFWSLSGQKLSWQMLPVFRLFRNYDVCVFYGNPRILSTVVYATLFRLLRKPIVIWGQAHSASAKRWSESARLIWWRIFKYFIVYTDVEAMTMERKGFAGKCVVGINNGLDQDKIEAAISQWTPSQLESWRRDQDLAGRKIVLTCTRIIEKNLLALFLESMPALALAHPDIVWCVIGDGPLLASLKLKATKLGVAERIRWVGAIYDEVELAPWFLSSQVMIHPGAIGLSLLHAFGYGLPVIIHDNLSLHGPEATALEDGVNGFLFRHGDSGSLQEALSRAIMLHPDQGRQFSQKAREITRTSYNTRVMVDRFHGVALAAADNTPYV